MKPYSKVRFEDENGRRMSYTARGRVVREAGADYDHVTSIGERAPSRADRRNRIMYPSKTPFFMCRECRF